MLCLLEDYPFILEPASCLGTEQDNFAVRLILLMCFSCRLESNSFLEGHWHNKLCISNSVLCG